MRRRVDKLEAVGQSGPEDEHEREKLRQRIRETAEHMNASFARRGAEPLFEITTEGDVLCSNDGKPVTTRRQTGAEESYWMQMEWVALDLIRGVEPYFTLGEAGAFVTPDGRFAVSRRRMDLRGLMGPRTEEMQKAIANAPERWERFLIADDEAAGVLERLLQLANDAAVPDDYCEPMHKWHDHGEICDRLGQHEFGSVFVNAVEREATRRTTWTLIHRPEARAMLSELTRRRDAFVAEEESSG